MENLQEFVNSGGSRLRVDQQAGVIRGVRIIGLESANGRRYLPEALQRAISLYESAKVNVNHPSGNPAANRDYRDRLGSIRNVSADAGGLRGDPHYNPKHALAEQLAWDAEHAPENIGLSHNVQGKTSRRGGKTVVEEITRVVSVDLVADPAATRGLFEQAEQCPAAVGNVPNVTDGKSFAHAVTDGGTEQESADFAEAVAGKPVSADRQALNEALGIKGDDKQRKDFARAITT
jgi:hypothetical protein